MTDTNLIPSFADYQERAVSTAIFAPEHDLAYLSAYLSSEAGEVAGKLAKAVRDLGVTTLADLPPEVAAAVLSECGDVLWGLAVLADRLNTDLHTVAADNLAKLADRRARGTLSGSGDHR